MQSFVKSAVGFVALAVAGCVDLGSDPVATETLFAAMNGQNMRPQPTDPRFGSAATSAIAEFGISSNSVTYDFFFSNIDSVTRGALYIGGTAVSGQEVATLFATPQAPSGTGTVPEALNRRLEPADITAPGVSFDSVLTAMRSGNAYVVVFTVRFPNGAIRGHTVPLAGAPPPELYATAMNGASERPNPVTTTATGNAYFEGSSAALRYHITVSNITGMTAAHIHRGSPAEAGPILRTLFMPTAPTGAVNGTLTTGAFTTTDGSQITMDSLLVLMRNGNAYVNVHTTANPDGEIRGQVEPANAIPPIP
jgi:hypothetical protein